MSEFDLAIQQLLAASHTYIHIASDETVARLEQDRAYTAKKEIIRNKWYKHTELYAPLGASFFIVNFLPMLFFDLFCTC